VSCPPRSFRYHAIGVPLHVYSDQVVKRLGAALRLSQFSFLSLALDLHQLAIALGVTGNGVPHSGHTRAVIRAVAQHLAQTRTEIAGAAAFFFRDGASASDHVIGSSGSPCVLVLPT
jgi:hypothetical protein